MNEPACKPDPVPARDGRATTIHLDTPSPGASSGPPADSDEQPSCASLHVIRAVAPRAMRPSTLLRVGFTQPPRSPGVLVRSYRTVSPLPRPRAWRFIFCGTDPAGYPGLPLATTLLCGVRTFLGSTGLSPGGDGPRPAAVRPARSPASLIPRALQPSVEMRGVVDQVNRGRPVRIEPNIRHRRQIEVQPEQ